MPYNEPYPPTPPYLVAESSDTKEIAYSKGLEASEQAYDRESNPYKPATSVLYHWWDSGWWVSTVR